MNEGLEKRVVKGRVGRYRVTCTRSGRYIRYLSTAYQPNVRPDNCHVESLWVVFEGNAPDGSPDLEPGVVVIEEVGGGDTSGDHGDPSSYIPVEYAGDFRRFTDAMAYKMVLNKHKGRWEDVNLEEMLKRLKDEVDELEEAIGTKNMVEILLEAADVANFAMIVASVAIERGK